MWNDELAVVAQRWMDQCPNHDKQPPHDSERSKLDGTPVGQNVALPKGLPVVMSVLNPKTGEWKNTTDIPADILKAKVKDEAGVQADVVEAGKVWYNEVSNPGGEQGHYTQLHSLGRH